MTIRDLLGRLEGVRQTGHSWKARCPAHDDREPSLTITPGEDGRILVHCHAGCECADVMASLGLAFSDLFADELTSPSSPLDSAARLSPVAAWLSDARRIDAGEIRRMFARQTARGPAVVFRYLSNDGRALYEKMRLVRAKTFWREPAGTPSVLYGLEELREAVSEQIIITEGELDAHALRSIGWHPVVSVPDGSNSRLTSELLGPLRPFRTVLIATDADAPGERLATRLAASLGAERCRRLIFAKDGQTFKDAGEALQASWRRADFDAALAAARAMPLSDLPANDNGEEESPYRVIGGMLCYVRTNRHGTDVVQRLSNFTATIDEEITRDDGAETTTHFRISGHLASGRALPAIVISASEYAGLAWLAKWGHGPTVFAGSGKKDHVRVAIDTMSNPTRRCVYAHAGWRQIAGRWAYLFHGGAVGADDVSVALDPPLDRVVLPRACTDALDAVRFSLRILECAPPEVAFPLLGAIYAAPLAFILEPDLTVWLVGTTGSYKSELATLAQRHFGAGFERTKLPVAWCATEAAIEHALHVLKDVLCTIDDYAPQPDLKSQHDLARRAERVLRNIGNRASRARMMADLRQRPSRPPRALVLSTGEDLPPNRSILARLVVVEVDKDKVDLGALTDLQKHGDRFSHAMRAFLTWLAPQLDELGRTLPEDLVAARDRFRAEGKHARQAGALATLYVGVDLLLQFSEAIGALNAATAAEHRKVAQLALVRLGERQAQHLRDIDPAERFVDVLREGIAQHRLVFLDKDNPGPPPGREAEMVGYIDARHAYVLPEVARRYVSSCLRQAGEPWEPSAHTLNRALVKRGCVIPGPDGRPETQRRFGGTRLRVLMMPIAVLWEIPPVPGSQSAPAAPSGGAGDGLPPSEPLLNKAFRELSRPSPLSPQIEDAPAAIDEAKG